MSVHSVHAMGSRLSGLSAMLSAATTRALTFPAGLAGTGLKEKKSMQRTTRTMRFALKPVIGLGLVSLLCQPLAAQTLPKHITKSSSSTLWWITQTGLGSAGEFEINNAANGNPALFVTTNGSGPALKAIATGSGDGIEGYGNNGGNGVLGYGSSSGSGGYFVAVNFGNGVFGQSNSGPGVRGQTFTGMGVYGLNINANNDGIVGGDKFGVRGNGHNFPGVYAYSDTNNGIFAHSDSGYAGYFDGDTYINGALHYNALSQNSDARYKQNIRTLPNALDTVLALRGVSYDWRQNEFPQMKFDKARQIGFIAQEIEKVVPELVSKDRQGMRSVAYTGVIPILVEAIKDQQKQIDTLKAQNKQLTSLQTQFAALSTKLAHLEEIQQASSRSALSKQVCLAHK